MRDRHGYSFDTIHPLVYKRTHEQLKQRIKGDLSVHIVDDTLIVDIQPVGSWTWHYTINNLAVQVSTGLSSRIVADIIVKQYKRYILSEHFYSK